MEILKRPKIVKHKSGDIRHYWMPKGVEFEIVETIIPPKHPQQLHAHRHYREMSLVLQGKLDAIEYKGDKKISKKLSAGSLVVFLNPNCHTLVNRSKGSAKIITTKFLGGGRRSSKKFRQDKIVCRHRAHSI